MEKDGAENAFLSDVVVAEHGLVEDGELHAATSDILSNHRHVLVPTSDSQSSDVFILIRGFTTKKSDHSEWLECIDLMAGQHRSFDYRWPSGDFGAIVRDLMLSAAATTAFTLASIVPAGSLARAVSLGGKKNAVEGGKSAVRVAKRFIKGTAGKQTKIAIHSAARYASGAGGVRLLTSDAPKSWREAQKNSKIAGEQLAYHILITPPDQRYHLAGHSLGTSVLLSALATLAKHGALDRIASINTLAGAVQLSDYETILMADERLTMVNYYSRNDGVLFWLFNGAEVTARAKSLSGIGAVVGFLALGGIALATGGGAIAALAVAGTGGVSGGFIGSILGAGRVFFLTGPLGRNVVKNRRAQNIRTDFGHNDYAAGICEHFAGLSFRPDVQSSGLRARATAAEVRQYVASHPVGSVVTLPDGLCEYEELDLRGLSDLTVTSEGMATLQNTLVRLDGASRISFENIAFAYVSENDNNPPQTRDSEQAVHQIRFPTSDTISFRQCKFVGVRLDLSDSSTIEFRNCEFAGPTLRLWGERSSCLWDCCEFHSFDEMGEFVDSEILFESCDFRNGNSILLTSSGRTVFFNGCVLNCKTAVSANGSLLSLIGMMFSECDVNLVVAQGGEVVLQGNTFSDCGGVTVHLESVNLTSEDNLFSNSAGYRLKGVSASITEDEWDSQAKHDRGFLKAKESSVDISSCTLSGCSRGEPVLDLKNGSLKMENVGFHEGQGCVALRIDGTVVASFKNTKFDGHSIAIELLNVERFSPTEMRFDQVSCLLSALQCGEIELVELITPEVPSSMRFKNSGLILRECKLQFAELSLESCDAVAISGCDLSATSSQSPVVMQDCRNVSIQGVSIVGANSAIQMTNSCYAIEQTSIQDVNNGMTLRSCSGRIISLDLRNFDIGILAELGELDATECEFSGTDSSVSIYIDGARGSLHDCRFAIGAIAIKAELGATVDVGTGVEFGSTRCHLDSFNSDVTIKNLSTESVQVLDLRHNELRFFESVCRSIALLSEAPEEPRLGQHGLYGGPSAIPERKIKGAISNYAVLHRDEKPLVCFDETFFGGSAKGWLVTPRGFHSSRKELNRKALFWRNVLDVEKTESGFILHTVDNKRLPIRAPSLEPLNRRIVDIIRAALAAYHGVELAELGAASSTTSNSSRDASAIDSSLQSDTTPSLGTRPKNAGRITIDVLKSAIFDIELDNKLNKIYLDKIPERKERNARRTCSIPESITIFGLVDTTLLGSAKNAVCITDGGLFWHNDWSAPHGDAAYFVSESDLAVMEISHEGTNVTVGENVIATAGSSMKAEELAGLLEALRSALTLSAG